ncbi:MAG: nuoC [Dehalococcoidia bacterium]|nr:nuoC [Dehalococcoidia bacterium]
MTAEVSEQAQEEPRERRRAPTGPPPGAQVPPSEDALKLESLLKELLSDVPLEMEYNFGELVAILPPEHIVRVCRTARADPRLDFDYLRCLSGADYVRHFEVVYHLYSIEKRHKMTLKIKLPHENPAVDSVISVWRGADWHEREMGEMFGIHVMGHPNMTALLLEDGLDEHPLLKSHPLVQVYEDRPGIITEKL